MRRLNRALLALCALTPATARGQTATLTPGQQHAIDSLMTVYRAAQRMPALSVAIGIRGTVVYARARGLAEIEHRVAATAKMTATAILHLVAARRIAVDGEIHQYRPGYPAQRSPISIRQLLLHQSGVRGSDNADVFTRDHYATVHDALARFGTDTLRFTPGTAMLYSNYGYVLLACAIERASGESYDAYLRKAVLEPAGATSTGPVNLYRVEPDRAESYIIRTTQTTSSMKGLWTAAHLASSPLDEPFPADVVDPSFEPGAGNYWSTPTDLVRYAMALDAGRLLPGSLRASQLTPQRRRPASRRVRWGGPRRRTMASRRFRCSAATGTVRRDSAGAGEASRYRHRVEHQLGHAIDAGAGHHRRHRTHRQPLNIVVIVRGVSRTSPETNRTEVHTLRRRSKRSCSD